MKKIIFFLIILFFNIIYCENAIKRAKYPLGDDKYWIINKNELYIYNSSIYEIYLGTGDVTISINHIYKINFINNQNDTIISYTDNDGKSIQLSCYKDSIDSIEGYCEGSHYYYIDKTTKKDIDLAINEYNKEVKDNFDNCINNKNKKVYNKYKKFKDIYKKNDKKVGKSWVDYLPFKREYLVLDYYSGTFVFNDSLINYEMNENSTIIISYYKISNIMENKTALTLDKEKSGYLFYEVPNGCIDESIKPNKFISYNLMYSKCPEQTEDIKIHDYTKLTINVTFDDFGMKVMMRYNHEPYITGYFTQLNEKRMKEIISYITIPTGPKPDNKGIYLDYTEKINNYDLLHNYYATDNYVIHFKEAKYTNYYKYTYCSNKGLKTSEDETYSSSYIFYVYKTYKDVYILNEDIISIMPHVKVEKTYPILFNTIEDTKTSAENRFNELYKENDIMKN